MGCFKVKTTRAGGSLTVETARTGGELYTCVSRTGGNLRTEASLVCMVSIEGKFIRIEPEHVWLMESNLYEADVGVYSNAEWKAE